MSIKEPDSPELHALQITKSGTFPAIIDFPKPDDRLMPDIKAIMQQVGAAMPMGNSIFIKQSRCYHKIKLHDIYLIKSMSDYLHIFTKAKSYIIHGTLNDMVKKLPETDFIRVHRSYIIRIDSISSIGDNMVTVEDRRIPISKSYKRLLMASINILS